MIKISQFLYAFPSGPSTNQITSWWLDFKKEPLLIDCPEIDSCMPEKLEKLAAGRFPKIILTSREAHANFKNLRKVFNWPALLQEQESYLLPGFEGIETFSEEYSMDCGIKLLWTPGRTPGSCIAYAPSPRNVLFCGRLLIPVGGNSLSPVRTKMTFHWSMQQNSLKKICEWLPSEPFPQLASGGCLNRLGDTKLLPWEAWVKSN